MLNTIGVEHVQVEFAEKQVEIEYDPNIIEAGFLKETVEKLGYKVV
ncbi:heavy-metal-associated domain-containing protein [Brevibacillus laterosporus]|nr:heavy-metal-associated domain-containing protein [Brevibacillus laterosporus]